MRIRSISAGGFATALLIGATQVTLGQYCRQTEASAPQCFFKDRAECESLSEKKPDTKCVQNPRLIDRAESQAERGSTPPGSSVGEPPRRPSGGEPPAKRASRWDAAAGADHALGGSGKRRTNTANID
jgi:hypothetical protein